MARVQIESVADIFAETSVAVTWTGLSVVVKNSHRDRRTILRTQTGYVQPQSILAVMGPSGSGKSTLLNTLAGRLNKRLEVTGEILINGHNTARAFGTLAYVTQDEVLTGTLTVYETVCYTAALRLPRNMPIQVKKEKANKTITELGLAKASNTYIGNWHLRGISGGQRRRVAIANELITNPRLLFLDEPTSGLDAASSYHLVRLMNSMAKNNRTIITTIHQPSSEVFEMLDELLLLSGGRPVYHGASSEAGNYLATAGLPCPSMRSLPDHFLHLVNNDFAEDDSCGMESQMISEQIEALVQKYNTEMAPAVREQTRLLSRPGTVFSGNRSDASPWTQLLFLTRRTFLSNVRNIGIFWLRVIMYLLLCICMGTVFFDLGKDFRGGVQGRASLLFFVVAFLTFMAIAGFPAFVEEMQVFIRERLNGYYGVGVFALANTLAAAPFVLIISMVATVGLYFLAGFNDDIGRVFYFVVALFCSLFVVESLMMAIAAVVPHFLMGIAAGAGVMGMFMIVCGFFKYRDELPDPVWRFPMHYVSFHTYAFNGLMQNEFQGTEGWCSACVRGPEHCSMTGAEVMRFYQLDDRNKWIDVAVLAGMCVAYRLVFYVMLKVKEMANH